MEGKEVYWKVHIPNLFKEIVDSNPEHNAIFRVPLMEVSEILSQIADRTRELNDTKLKLLCCRLTLFEIADPESKEYNRDVFRILENDIRKEESEQ